MDRHRCSSKAKKLKKRMLQKGRIGAALDCRAFYWIELIRKRIESKILFRMFRNLKTWYLHPQRLRLSTWPNIPNYVTLCFYAIISSSFLFFELVIFRRHILLFYYFHVNPFLKYTLLYTLIYVSIKNTRNKKSYKSNSSEFFFILSTFFS